MLEYYRLSNCLYVDEQTGLISIKNKTLNSANVIPSHSSENIITQESSLCLPLALFQPAFAKIHEHSHAGITIAQNNFNQYYYIPLQQKGLPIFIHDCIKCQTIKHVKMTNQKPALLLFSKLAP